MHKITLACAVSLFSFLIISCSGTTKQYMSPELEGDYNNESVALLVIEREDFPGIESDHQFGELRINEQPIFKDKLTDLLRNATGANVKSEINPLDIDPSKFKVRQFTEGGTNLKFVAPSDGTELSGKHESPRFVIMLDGFRFDSYEDFIGGGSYAGHEPTVVPRLTFKTNYLIWDNTKQHAVAWGTIGSDKVIKLARIEEIYDELILDSFQRMNKMSPFQRNNS